MRARPLFFLATALLLAAGCRGDSPTGTAPPSDGAFEAAIRGAVTAGFEGRGRFVVHVVPRVGGAMPRGHFMLFASEVDVQAQRGQAIDLMRAGGEIPAVGRYPIEPIASGAASTGGFEARYSFVHGDTTQVFVASAGEVEITRSLRDRVEGHFRFTGARICLVTRDQALPVCRWPVLPWEPQPDLDALPGIEVTGSFVAVPAPVMHGFGR